MIPEQISYPNFEANQVLSSAHLNDLFKYLDEQDRLTRTNLIGIGIVCGLEPSIAVTGDSMRISKGCGVTSAGYMVVWEDAAPLEWVRPYGVPVELPYREFENRATDPPQAFPMWELVADRNDDSTATRLSSDFLTGNNQPMGSDDEKILVLFLECLAESNRNCTPNSCNDKGTTVTASVRPLLIRRSDIDLLQARVEALGPDAQAYFTIANSTNARYGLPTLKLPRYDVSGTILGSTTSVLSAFQSALNAALVNSVAAALNEAYTAFQPLLPAFPTNPFLNLDSLWAFLHDGSIETNNLYLWYQYYYDHLDTVIQAYDEFRLKGMDVLGLCCPDKRLFPRHLMLGNVGVDPVDYAYRHTFVPSPIYSIQNGEMEELRLLFQRLVELILVLELPPNLNLVLGDGSNRRLGLDFLRANNFNRPIRITPSHLGKPLSQKAIPYHYRPVPLYEYWNFHLNRQGKANENLGFRSPSWDSGVPFVRFPLAYDLEPYSFLRIEGHIGRNFQDVLENLIHQKEVNRLPIDLVAVKTGYNEDNIPMPPEVEGCHFQDLEALYAAFREELLCQICELLKHLYNLPYPPDSPPRTRVQQAPRLTALRRCAPEFRYYTDTLGEFYENRLNSFAISPFFSNFFFVPAYVNYVLSIIPRLNNLLLSLSETLSFFGFDDFRNIYGPLRSSIEPVNRNLIFITNDTDEGGNNANLDLEELQDQLDHFLYACKLETFQRINSEYERRVENLKERLLLSNFARKHDGLQHKAGVPLGGTFVMVYHGEDQQDAIPRRPGFFTVRGQVVDESGPLPGVNIVVVGTSTGTMTDFDGNFVLFRVSLPARLKISYIGFPDRQVWVTSNTSPLRIDMGSDQPETGSTGRFNDIGVGVVIADFYLPYLCCSDCAPVQFVLPKAPPTFIWEQQGCTDSKGGGMVLITASGGTAPYEYSTDSGQKWIALGEDATFMIDGAQIQIRDAEGTISVRRTVQLTPPFVVSQLGPGECNPQGTEFTVEFAISGGRPPYTLLTENTTSTVQAGQNATLTLPSNQGAELRVTDSNDPACEQLIKVEPVNCPEPCGLPCNGITLEPRYPFWLQRNSNADLVYHDVQLIVTNFELFLENGDSLPVDTGQLTEILNPDRDIATNNFLLFWNNAIAKANKFIRQELGDKLGIEETPIRLTLVQDSSPNVSTLRIEHFECHRFEFSLEVRFMTDIGNFKPSYTRVFSYNQLGTTFTENIENIEKPRSNKGVLPAFDVMRRDRCNPDSKETPLCKEPKETAITFKTEERNIFLGTKPSEDLPTLWILEHGIPALFLGTAMESSIMGNTAYEAKVIVVNPDTACAAIDVRDVRIDIII